VTASPTETIKPVDNHDIVITDEEYSAARALLATLPDFGAALQVEAEAELALRNIHDAPIPLIITRAAGIATQLKDRP
jgi:hypothetical protein